MIAAVRNVRKMHAHGGGRRAFCAPCARWTRTSTRTAVGDCLRPPPPQTCEGNVSQQNPTRLTPRQARAAGMLAYGRRMAATAKAVGVHRVTLWEWMKLPKFQEQMNELRRAAWRSARDRMRENTA